MSWRGLLLALPFVLSACSGSCDRSGCAQGRSGAVGQSTSSGGDAWLGALILMSATSSHSGTR